MKYMEFIDSTFFAFTAKSELLCDLFDDLYLFGNDDSELSFGWAVKGDAFIGEEEEYISYDSALPQETPTNFDFCQYLISMFKKHTECGMIDAFEWREGLRTYDADGNVNYGESPLYCNIMGATDVQSIISALEANKDAINQSIEKFCIFEYNFMGEYDESSLELLSFKDGCYSRETLDECAVNDLMNSESFNDDIISDECDMEALLETLLEEYY